MFSALNFTSMHILYILLCFISFYLYTAFISICCLLGFIVIQFHCWKYVDRVRTRKTGISRESLNLSVNFHLLKCHWGSSLSLSHLFVSVNDWSMLPLPFFTSLHSYTLSVKGGIFCKYSFSLMSFLVLWNNERQYSTFKNKQSHVVTVCLRFSLGS